MFSASIGASIGLPLELQTQTTLKVVEFSRLPLGLPLRLPLDFHWTSIGTIATTIDVWVQAVGRTFDVAEVVVAPSVGTISPCLEE